MTDRATVKERAGHWKRDPQIVDAEKIERGLVAAGRALERDAERMRGVLARAARGIAEVVADAERQLGLVAPRVTVGVDVARPEVVVEHVAGVGYIGEHGEEPFERRVARMLLPDDADEDAVHEAEAKLLAWLHLGYLEITDAGRESLGRRGIG